MQCLRLPSDALSRHHPTQVYFWPVTHHLFYPCPRCGSATDERDGANRRVQTNWQHSTICCRGASHPQECQLCPHTSCQTPPTQPPPFPKVSIHLPALLLSSCPTSPCWPFFPWFALHHPIDHSFSALPYITLLAIPSLVCTTSSHCPFLLSFALQHPIDHSFSPLPYNIPSVISDL